MALKTIRRELWEGDDGPELRERFLREARAAGRLLHPGIVTIYEFGESDGAAFIAMEHITGDALNDLVAQGRRFTPDEVLQIIIPVLKALGYSHRFGVIHRDIKPANIMITTDGDIKILDFGVARLSSANITQAGTILGTLTYMAPEQLQGESVDSRADLYSVGVLLWELLTGKRLYSGGYAQVLNQVLQGIPPKPSEADPAIPAVFDAVLDCALAKEPGARFESAEAFIAALTDLDAQLLDQTVTITTSPDLTVVPGFSTTGDDDGNEHTVVVAPPTLVAEPIPMKMTSPPVLPREEAAHPRDGRSRSLTAPVTLAVLALFLAAGGGLYYAFGTTSLPVQPPSPEKPAQPSQPQVEPAPILRVVTDRGGAPSYHVGEEMVVKVSSDTPTNAYCFYQDGAGQIVRIFPNRFSPDPQITPGRELAVPSAGQPFHLRFDTPSVHEVVACVSLKRGIATRAPALLGGAGLETLPVSSMDKLVDVLRQAAGEEIAVSTIVVTIK